MIEETNKWHVVTLTDRHLVWLYVQWLLYYYMSITRLRPIGTIIGAKKGHIVKIPNSVYVMILNTTFVL